MNNKVFNYIFRLKFVVLTLLIFLSIALLTKYDLAFFYPDGRVSSFEAILYSFNLSESTGISLNMLKVISIYLVIIYLVYNFVTEHLGKVKYSTILRGGDLRKYIIKLLASSYIISFIYFFLGMSVIYLININNFEYIDIYQIKTSLKIFISTNIIMFFIIDIMFIAILKTKKITNSIIMSISILLLGFMDISPVVLPVNYIYTYKIIKSLDYIYSYYAIYVLIIISLTIYIVYIVKKDKDFLLFEYEI